MSSNAFNLLAQPIQRILWDMGWKELRHIQVEAIRKVLQDDCDIVISARTASGKTEAAFLPILSSIYENPKPSVQAIYVGPLKALINDQFRRLEDLCRRAEIAVHRWHGDVDGGKKRNMLRQPSGVLLITPESIESLFVNHSTTLSTVFSNLQFVVIDEVHAFIGSERGTHLRSLLYRLQHEANQDFKIAALSATLGDAAGEYNNWLRPDDPSRVHHIHDASEQKRVMYRLHGYGLPSPSRRNSHSDDSGEESEISRVPTGIVQDMHDAFAGTTSLIFANSREDVECYADSLNEHCQRLGKSPEFLVHHGSLSKEIREHAEQAMKSKRPHTTLCSSTLELGIDIGNVASVGQIGPPWSTSSLVQRLGRSGRGDGEPQVMRVFVIEHEMDANARLVDQFYPGLLRAIASTELMLQKWGEPPRISECDLSTLTQQVLSVLAQTGGIRADRLHQRLVSKGAFRKIGQSVYTDLLRSLASNELIEQMPTGDLILAPKGERVVGHYSFYSAFATPVEYTVVHKTRPIGRLPSLSLPKEHDHLLLAARRWEVLSVDHDRSEILVVPARSRKTPRFLGSVGEIHPKTRQMMREALLSDKDYSYLNGTGKQLLRQARQAARNSNLAKEAIISLGKESCLWFTWTGTIIQRTLCLMADAIGLDASDQDIAIQFKASRDEVLYEFRQLLESPPTAYELASQVFDKRIRKFDEYISNDLLDESLARDYIDIPAAVQIIKTLPAPREPRPEKTVKAKSRGPNLTLKRLPANVEFVAFDLETTGLSPTSCEIVEFGAVRFRPDGTEIAHTQQLVDQGCPIPRMATRIHGITDAMVKGKPRLPEVLPGFVNFLSGPNTVLLAHNARFDISFLRAAMHKVGINHRKWPVIDTLSLARHCIEGLPSYQLKQVASELGITVTESHRALADARVVMNIFVKLMQRSPEIRIIENASY